jgi:uncharacterized protein
MIGGELLESFPRVFLAVLALLLWVGHACIWTTVLNHRYGRPIPKWFLRSYRLLCGVVILGFPALLAAFWFCTYPAILGSYLLSCLVFGAILFPAITLRRFFRTVPPGLIQSETQTTDYWPILGKRAIGDGKWQWMTRVPFTCAFQVDYTKLTLELKTLPKAWSNLRILLLTDLHFHGTPSREFFDAVFAELRTQPEPDLVIFAGDLLDTDVHHAWVQPLLGDLSAREGKFAILGNHDDHHEPERIRQELLSAGFQVLGNGWKQVTIRGEACTLVGHEGPWFTGSADLREAPAEPFRLLISHTPDNLPWAVDQHVDLMLSGHVHGGQIRLPIIGSIFVPSIYGRRYDEGVFEKEGTVLVVNRGLSGKEPLRFRCNPQIIELTLRPSVV